MLRWSARGAVALAILLFTGVAGTFLFLGTQTGRDAVARLAEGALSDARTTVRIADVSGNLASDFRIGELAVADDAGNVLIVEEARLAWNPFALLGGTLDIDTLEIGRVSVSGIGGEEPEKAGAPDSAALPALAIRVGTIAIREIALDPAVLGEAQRLSLEGSLSASAAPLSVKAEGRLRRLGGTPGHADIDIAYTARPAQFTARIDVAEPAGGLIAHLAGLPADTPLSIRLAGEGPPDGWRGRLTAQAGSLAELKSDLAVAVAEGGATLSLEGTASIAGLLPPQVRPLAAGAIRFQAALAHAESGDLVVREFTAATGAVSARLSGKYDPARDTIGATFGLSGGANLSLSALAPGLVLDGAALDGTLAGTTAAPVLSARLAARHLSLPEVTATGIDGQLRLAVYPDRPMALSGTVQADSVDAANVLPAGLIGQSLALELDALMQSDGTVPRLDLKARSGSFSAEIDGSLPNSKTVEGRYAVTHAALGDFLASIGVPLRGAVEADGNFRTDLATGDTQLGLAGRMTGTGSDDPWLAALTGRQLSLAGTVAWIQGEETLRLTGLDVVSDAARVEGDATIRLAGDRIEARYAVSVPDLARLAGPAGVGLAGRARITGTAQGALQAPEVRAQVATTGLAIDGVALGDVGAGVAAQPAKDGYRASARLNGALAGKPLSGTLDVVAAGTTVRLREMKVALGRNALVGELAVDTARSRLTGDATLELADARDLPALAGLPRFASGAGRVKLALAYEDGQRLAIDAELKSLALGGDPSGAVSAARLNAKAVIRDPFAKPAIDGRLRLTGVRGGGAVLTGAELTAKGALGALAWTVSAEGAQPVPLSLTSRGTLALAGADLSARVERLEGTVAEHAVRLRAPAPVSVAGTAVEAGPIDLAVGGGTVRLRLAAGDARLEATGDVDGLPLTLASLAQPDLDLAGTVSGTVRVGGAGPVPSIDVALTASGVRPTDIAPEEFQGLTVKATLRQDSAATRMALTLTGPDDTAAEGALQTAPLVLLGPLRLVDLDRQSLSGRIDAHAQLGIVDRLVALGGDRLAGLLQARVTLAGTVAQPVIEGTASLEKGAYEGAATGAILRGAEARIEFTGDGARLVSLTATDGNGGRLEGSGRFAFASGASAADRLTVRVEQFTALRRPEAEIVTTGAVTLEGPLQSPTVSGRLTVDRGELRIPDRLPEGVVELEVEEINLPDTEAVASREAEPSASASLPVALDLAIDFPGRTFVRGRGLDSEWKGALTVKGTSGKPVIAGKLSVVRGTFAFAGKTFVLKNGSVAFTGSEAIEPELDATAEADLKDLTARIQISGKLSRPNLSVSSDPPMPQEDVLAHILFGRTTGQLSAIQAAQLAQTAAVLSGRGGGANIVDRVRQALGVDVLNVEAGETGSGASLKAGKYITDNVFLSVRQGTEPGSQKMGVEVEVLPNLSVESDISGDASSNVGINWKFDY